VLDKRILNLTKAIVLLVAIALGVSLVAGGVQQRPPLEIAGYQATMDERLGKDDGAAFVIHFTGDIHGTLEPCG
jgi:hypothetical protein